MKGHYPINSLGNMIEYPCSWRDDFKPVQWIQMHKFKARMYFSHYEKGRSSLRLICNDSVGKTWSIMAQSMDEFIHNSMLGSLYGEWEVVKRGANYGVILKEVLSDE